MLGAHLENTRLEKGEHPLELLELGETMIAKYFSEVAPLIQPAAVEERVSGMIGAVRVAGYLDLMDVEGRIVDSKTALKPIICRDASPDGSGLASRGDFSTAAQ